MTLNVPVERLTSRLHAASWRWPRNVRFCALIRSMQPGGGGLRNDGTRTPNRLRVDCGAVGARSGDPDPTGLSHVPLCDALASRNERSSRKNTSRFLPQRNLRYRPLRLDHDTGE